MKFVPAEIVHRSAWLNCRFIKIIPESQVINLLFNAFFILLNITCQQYPFVFQLFKDSGIRGMLVKRTVSHTRSW